MDKIESKANELREMDELAAMSSPVHFLHPLAKLIVTITYILVTVSFNKYDINGLFVMLLYPVLFFAFGGLSVKKCFYKLRLVLPLVIAVGLFNPFFDRVPMMTIGRITLTGGMVSMLTLMMKGLFCLMASFGLAATTSIDAICKALRKIHIPDIFVTLLLLTYRYIGVMVDEVAIMNTAYRLRAPGQKGIHYKAWGSFLGQLLLRSMDRAEELYSSMQLRGFNGNFYYADLKKAKLRDYLFTMISIALFILCRYVNLAALLGGVITGGIK